MVKDLGHELLNGHQDSDGDLDRSDEGNGGQNSPGDLKCPSKNNLMVTSETIVELKLHEIQPFTLIPDYLEPTVSKHPIVVKTPKSYHCIEGWSLVKKARSAGDDKIRCHVSYFQEASEDELAIRKVAIRTIPQGGKSSYAERVRNMQILFKHLMETLENPLLFAHGGDRKSTEFTNNKEDDLRQLMAKRTGVSKVTVNKCLNYAEYINDEAIEMLVASKAERGFFEAAQKNKSKLIERLRNVGESEENMAREISAAILKWLEQYRETGKIESILRTGENLSDDTPSEPSPQKDRCILRPRKRFNHWARNDDGPEAAEPTTENVQNILTEIAQRMDGLATVSNFTVQQALEPVKAMLTDLAQVYAELEYLNQKQSDENDNEVK